MIPNEDGVYEINNDYSDSIDVYNHPIKGLCVFGPDYGYNDGDDDLNEWWHVRVDQCGLNFIKRIKDL